MSTDKTNGRILVVDNDGTVATTLAMVLRRAGFHALDANSGEDALTLLKGDTFDLLLSDVIMPGISGVELAMQVADDRLAPNVLLMSGMSATADLLEYARKRGYYFPILAKPTHPTDVVNKINELLKAGPPISLM